MITQFQGEDRESAIVNHFSLDIEEEQEFFAYVQEMGYSIEDEDSLIESLIKMFRDSRN